MNAVTKNEVTQDERGQLAEPNPRGPASLRRAIGAGAGTPGGELSVGRAAIVAGLGLLVMAVLSSFSYVTLQNLIVEGDAAKTAGNIVDHELLFRAAASGFVIVAALDVAVAWALYVFLRPVNRGVALLGAWLRLAHAAVFAAASTSLFVAVRLPTDADTVDAFGTRQLNAQVMASLNAFEDGLDVALVIFGLHLLVLGYLLIKSGYIPGVLGILVVIASLGYLTDSFGSFLSKSYDAEVGRFTFAGEVLLMGWLLWRNRRLQEAGLPQRP